MTFTINESVFVMNTREEPEIKDVETQPKKSFDEQLDFKLKARLKGESELKFVEVGERLKKVDLRLVNYLSKRKNIKI